MVFIKKCIIILYLSFCFVNIFSIQVTITVIDKDLEIPLEGVKILIKNTEDLYFTDIEGKAFIITNESFGRMVLSLTLIGYEPVKMVLKEYDKEIIIKMNLEGVLEGKELIIEEERTGESDEEAGISKVIEQNEFKSTSMMGAVEDLMNTIKVLPGVSYTGKFNSKLSVRGSEPDGLTTIMDGFVVKYPYHWGRAFSIFNPNIIESVKISTGIFSVKDGLCTSGLMEVNTIVPNDGLKFEALLSASTVEFLIQTPVGDKDKSGLFIGSRTTFYDLIFLMTGKLMEEYRGLTMSRIPYIYDGYFKWFYRPSERFEWYINGFIGTDGIGLKTVEINKDPDEEIVNNFDFKWMNIYTFVNTGFTALPHNRIFMKVTSGYDFLLNDLQGITTSKGKKEYSNEFITEYPVETGGDTEFSVDTESVINWTKQIHGIQHRFDVDFTLHEKVYLSYGQGIFADFYSYIKNEDSWNVVWESGNPEYKKISEDVYVDKNKILKSFLYANFTFHPVPGTVKIDLGCRLDHNIVIGTAGFYLNTYPVAGPRFNISFTPVKDLKYLKRLTFSTGAGLFSKLPEITPELNEDYGINPDFGYTMTKSFSTLLGMEIEFCHSFKFKIEGYYKFEFDRFYITAQSTGSSDSALNRDYNSYSDGYGHIAGFDIMLERKISRYLDGLISYSFVYAGFINPNHKNADSNQTISGEPAGIWYYPDYHRFHNLNVLINIKPASFMTITPKFSFVSGSPEIKYGNKKMFAALMENGKYAEMYSRKEYYNEKERTVYKLFLDLKISFNYYIVKSKVKVESYIAVEDILAVVFYYYGPKSDAVETDLFTGEDKPKPESDFDFGIPIISFGWKLSY